MLRFFRVQFRANPGTATTPATIIAPFARLGNAPDYFRRVMSGQQPFAHWTPTASVHPLTGEPVLMRARTLYPGRDIAHVTEVQWTATEIAPALDTPDSTFWRPVAVPEAGSQGTLLVRANDAWGQRALTENPALTEGTVLPIRAAVLPNDTGMVTYVVAKWGTTPAESRFVTRTQTFDGALVLLSEDTAPVTPDAAPTDAEDGEQD